MIDDVTGQVIHVGGPGFKYGGPGSGSPVTLAEIFVRVLDENVDVWRPVKAEQIAWDRFRIVEQPNDRGTERWDFEPGDEVMCELVDSDDETFLTTLLQP
ncbi:MAG TPA: hypothetical protein VGO10_04055 [Baekduia sp.]|nr:hypothetical protein [Baekduia sp.]